MLAVILTGELSCKKEATQAEYNVSYRLLAEKTWYLAYSESITGSNTITKSYVGQSTYFINYLKNLTTLDSDGYEGEYSLQKTDGHLIIKVAAKTANGNLSNYQYKIVSLGAKNLILNYTTGNTLTQLYFTTQR